MTELPLHWQRADLLAQRIRLAVRPLYRIEGKRLPHLVGCSVLLRVADRRFLLTAAHVLDEFGKHIHVMSPPTFGGLTGAHHSNARPRRKDREDDPLDAGVFAQMPGSEVSELEGHYLTVDDIDVNSWPSEGQPHLMIGFPASRSNRVAGKTVTPDWLTYVAEEASPDTYRKRHLSPIRNLILDFDIARARRPDGTEVRGPSFNGVSGTGIWRFASRDDPINAASEKLVAIFTAYEDELLFATRLALHIALIAAHYPALRKHLPESRSWRILMNPGASVDASTLSD